MRPLPIEELEQNSYIYEAYIRLRDGIKPVSDPNVRTQLWQEYASRTSDAITANRQLSPSASQNCHRFFRLFDRLLIELRDGYHQYLNDTSMDQMTFVNLDARLQILRLFHTSLFSMVLVDAEGGYMQLDPSVRYQCEIPDRNAWKNTLFKAHQSLENLHLAVFGQKPVGSPITQASVLSDLNERYKIAKNKKKAVQITTEVIAGVLIWNKAVDPFIDRVNKILRRGWLRRINTMATSVAFVVSWVSFDRFLRERVDYLKTPPEIKDPNTFSDWLNMVEFGEEFVDSKIVSPPLNLSYLRLLGNIERQRALDFLTVNEWVLVDAEERYGSVDAALNNFKEVSGL